MWARKYGKKIDMWKVKCGIPVKEQGIILLLQSIIDNKKAEKAISTLITQDLNRDRGLNILIDKLGMLSSMELLRAFILFI